MLKTHFGFKRIEDGFDNETLAEHDLIGHGHKIVFHVSADACDEMQAALPEFPEACLADIAFVRINLSCEVAGDVVENGTVRFIARRDPAGHDLPLVIDDEVELKAEEPAHRGLASCRHAVEDLVTADAAVMADGKLC